MTDREMPLHIVRHSLAVRNVAVAVARFLIKAGFTIDLRLVDRASLLHDICKIDSIKAGGDHALMGRKLLDGYGCYGIGNVIGQHVRLESLNIDEAMVVHYADKRAMHDRVVSLDRRFIDLMDRYGTDDGRMQRIISHCVNARKIEKVLVDASGMDPAWLDNLNLIPGDHALYGRHGFLGEHGAVEEQDQNIDLERVDEHEPVQVDEGNLPRG